MIKVTLYTDLVCPFCYLMSPVLEALVADKTIDLSIEHFELRPEGTPQIDFFKEKDKYELLIGPLKKRCDTQGLALCTEQRVLPRTATAFRAIETAKFFTQEVPYYFKLCHESFANCAPIDDETFLFSVAESLGMDRKAFEKHFYNTNYESSRDPNITGIPTFKINGHYYNGLLSKEEFLTILNK